MTPSLNAANSSTGLPKQMSEDWIERPGELANAIGGDEVLAQQIINSDYIRIIATHGPDGNKVYNLINGTGDVATIGNIWTP